MLLLLLLPAPLWAAPQYSQTQCNNLKQQKELVRKRLNAGYGSAEGEQLRQQDQRLFQLIAQHCVSLGEAEDEASANTQSQTLTYSAHR